MPSLATEPCVDVETLSETEEEGLLDPNEKHLRETCFVFCPVVTARINSASMSVKRKKAGTVFSWQKSFSILAPWKKGKGDMVLDSEVVLTKMKLFHNFHERLLMAADTTSTISTVSVSEQDISEAVRVSEDTGPPTDNASGQNVTVSSSEYLSSLFSDSQLPRLYKFESEDSGVELPSGANSPSTPTGSEQSFVVHSRESSCDSCHLKPPAAIPDARLCLHPQGSENDEAGEPEENPAGPEAVARDSMLIASEELSFYAEREDLHVTEGTDGAPCLGLQDTADKDEENCEQAEETCDATETDLSENRRPRSQSSAGACDGTTVDLGQGPLRKIMTSDSLEEYMEECCRLSEVQQASSNPLGSGLGYLEHICQLIEKIGQLQETNLLLQRQICGLQRDRGVTTTKEDFFQEHCSCGAASLAFQDTQKKHSRNEFLSPSGTLSDLSTIPEVARHPFVSTRRDVSGAGLRHPLAPVPPWGRGPNRAGSYAEGGSRPACDGGEGLAVPQRRSSESPTWGRVKDLVRRSKLKKNSRLGLTSSSLKMSCPQLYRPDIGPVELPGRNRNSMIALGHQNKLDFPWLE